MDDYLALAVASRTTPLRDDQTGCAAAVGSGERREGLLTSLRVGFALGCEWFSAYLQTFFLQLIWWNRGHGPLTAPQVWVPVVMSSSQRLLANFERTLKAGK
jgi:hypothetical protein